MRIEITDKRAKTMARTLNAFASEAGLGRLGHARALDAVARMLGFADANALGARLRPTIPDVRSLDAPTLQQTAIDLYSELETIANDYAYARDHDVAEDRADRLAAELDRLAETAVAVGREARRRRRPNMCPVEARHVNGALSSAEFALDNAPHPWRKRAREVQKKAPDGTASLRPPLPSVLDRAFQAVADEIRPRVAERFEADPDEGRLQLFYGGFKPEQYFVSLVVRGDEIRFSAKMDTRTEGMDGDETIVETNYEDLGEHDDLFSAIEACLEDQDERMFDTDIAGEADEAPEDRLPEYAAYLDLKTRVERAFFGIVGTLDRDAPTG